MLILTTLTQRPHAVARSAATAARVKGTSVSAARTRFGAAPQATALLPFSAAVMTDVVGTDAIAGIRSWSPPV